MIKIAPSILSSDFASLGRDVEECVMGGAEYLHIDVMDGMFVPNISIGSCVQKSIRKFGNIVFDTHLMIVDPIRYVEDFYKTGSDIITIHLESCQPHEVKECLCKIRSFGIKAGLSIKPKTPVEALIPYIGDFDMLLIMSVEPGFGGQSFIESSLEKIEKSRKLLPDLDIEVDGGISKSNIKKVVEAGANVIVAGSAVFKGDIITSIKELREAAE